MRQVHGTAPQAVWRARAVRTLLPGVLETCFINLCLKFPDLKDVLPLNSSVSTNNAKTRCVCEVSSHREPRLPTVEPTSSSRHMGPDQGADAGLQHRCPWALHCVTWRRPFPGRQCGHHTRPPGAALHCGPHHATQHIGMPLECGGVQHSAQDPPRCRRVVATTGLVTWVSRHNLQSLWVFTQEVTQSENSLIQWKNKCIFIIMRSNN